MSSLPYGVHIAGIPETRSHRVSVPKLLVFSAVLLSALLFWSGLGWLVLRTLS